MNRGSGAPLVDRVTRRPWLSITLAGGALVALAIPALHLKTVVSGVDDFLPQDTPIVQTYNLVKDTFPTEGVTTTVVVEATDVRSGEVATEITALQALVDESRSFLPGTSVIYSADSSVAKIDIPTVGTGNDDASTNALNEVRNQIVPATIGQVDGATVNVSGVAAQSVDQRSKLNERLPFVFAFVFGLAFLLMLVTFRSIVIPIKAIVLNLLSVGAAYGVLVLVFQDGHGESLLDFTSNGGIGSWLPLFLFVVLFGLSMDYHVFILSRVREAYLSGMSTPDAVRHAISSTAGTVTSAALIMVGVFGTFTTSSLLDAERAGRWPGRSGADRRDDRSRRAATRVDEGSRRLELVSAELARVAATGGLRGPGSKEGSASGQARGTTQAQAGTLAGLAPT